MSKKKLPFISVVVCCYNGADVLADTLTALKAQKYEGKLEIIVVDDGSKDDTFGVASSFAKVRAIRNEVNKGLAASRNVGIEAAKGTIVAFTDDDCRPKPTWIKELAAAYAKDNVQGAGGAVASTDTDGVVLRYLAESKPLKPLENTLLVSKKLSYRFGLYLKGLAGALPQPKNRRRPVYSLVGASMSFRKTVLEEVGMFDAHFRFGGEEEDICKRINELHPRSLLFMPKAKMIHQFERSLRDTLRRSQAYAKGNARMYHKHADVNPVIFPFPPAIVLSALLGVLHPVLYALPFVLVPLVYLRWTILAVTRLRPEAMLYGYIQFLQEWYGNIGFIKGWWQYRNLFADTRTSIEKPVPLPEVSGPRLLGKTKIFVMLTAAMTLWNLLMFTHNPLQFAASLLVLLIIPGTFILWITRIMPQRITGKLYTIVASITAMLFISLLANTVTAVTHGRIPLDAPLMVIVTDVVVALLGYIAWRRTSNQLYTQLMLPSLSHCVAAMLLAIPPLAAVVGANLLNQHNTNALSMVVLAAVAVIAVVTTIYIRKLRPGYTAAIMYSLGLAVLLLGALRGDFIGGTDISKEFYLYQLTQAIGHWSPSVYHDAYNACLSITTLPMLLSKLLKVDNLTLFKVLFPAVYALLPVMTYALLRRWTSRLIAFIAALLFIAQPVFTTWSLIPIRQIFGFLFFAALLMIIFDEKVTQKVRTGLFLLFGAALVLSHYSTTYIAIGALSFMYIVQWIYYMLGRRFKQWQADTFTPTLGLPLLVAFIAMAAVWYGPVTHVSSNITTRFTKISEHIRHNDWNGLFTDSHSKDTSIVDQFRFGESQPDAKQLWKDYQARAEQKAKDAFIQPMQLRSESEAITPVADKPMPAKAPAPIVALSPKFGDFFSKILRIFLVIGLVGFVLSMRRGYSRTDGYKTFALGAAAILLAIIVVPYASIDYDLVRTSQQLLVILALPTILGGIWLLRTLTRKRLSEVAASYIIGGIVMMFFLFMSGFIPQLVGGDKATMVLNNSGNQYNQLFTYQSEVAAATWLRHNKVDDTPVYSGYFGGSRLQLAGIDRSTFYNDILPWTVSREGYVFSSRAETQLDTATTYYHGSFISYPYPDQALSNKKDVLYDSGQAKIYK
jgi:uncharacterized membrane protein/glycosyltransferase involved in cell wall biosynthesis